MATIAEALDQARRHHAAGALPQAEDIYRRILAVEPDHPDALHLLGVIARQMGRDDLAMDLIARALVHRPDFPEARNNLGGCLQHLGRLEEAIASYRRAIADRPDFPLAHANLGDALRELGDIRNDPGLVAEAVASCRRAVAAAPGNADMRNSLGLALRCRGDIEEAVATLRQAVAIDPDFARAHVNLGNALLDFGSVEDAAASYRRAVAVDPSCAEAYNNLGHLLLTRLDRADEAVGHFRAAIGVKPDYADAHNNLGNALQSLGRFGEAIPCHQAALSVTPDCPMARTNLGNALKEMGRIDEAAETYRAVLARNPGHGDAHNGLGTIQLDRGQLSLAMDTFRRALADPAAEADAHCNIGLAHKILGKLDDAIDHFDRALAIKPDAPRARVNRALTFFLGGQLSRAWADYGWRWKDHRENPKRPFPQPWWEGQPLDGKTLLIWGEQGLGEQVMGAGMIADVIAAGGACLYECEPRLVTLFARSFPSVRVLPRSTPPDPRALEADYQTPVLGLAPYFRGGAANFPDHAGYLTADPDKVRHWKTWLEGLPKGLKIGFTWKGRVSPGREPHFPSLEKFAAILGVPGLTFVNLQYDECSEDIDAIRRDMGVEVHCPPDLDLTNDLDGIAALIAGLDGVVGSMTVAVILAGALGRPAWMYAFYPFAGEMGICDRDHMLWCPSIRVEKRGFGEDWSGSLGRIAASLTTLAAAGGEE